MSISYSITQNGKKLKNSTFWADLSFKDTYMEKAPSNKTPAFPKSMNRNI